MSNVYFSEPQTKGKVILTTTLGEIEIELWPKEAPNACRNFVQLCLEGYYNNNIFHRVVKDFIAQTGDASGLGGSGTTIFENQKKFEDEFHSRLKFTHRGLVGCAGGDNQNDSEFFITLEKTESLNYKHTIFGKVVGDTIFNILKVNDLEILDSERPKYPPKILKTEVIWNPFDDIVPRNHPIINKSSVNNKIGNHIIKEKTKKSNVALLSFAEDEEEDLVSGASMKSLHDVLKGDRHLSQQPVVKNIVLLSSSGKEKVVSDHPLSSSSTYPSSSNLSYKEQSDRQDKNAKSTSTTPNDRPVMKKNGHESALDSKEAIKIIEDEENADLLYRHPSSSSANKKKEESSERKLQNDQNLETGEMMIKVPPDAGRRYLERQKEKYGSRKRDRASEIETMKKIEKFRKSIAKNSTYAAWKHSSTSKEGNVNPDGEIQEGYEVIDPLDNT